MASFLKMFEPPRRLFVPAQTQETDEPDTKTKPAVRLLSDCVVVAVLLALFGALAYLLPAIDAPIGPAGIPSTVSTDLRDLPYYALRSVLRMAIALLCSLVFTFVYGLAAARSRRLGKVLIPVLDVLQSVPILGFLSATVTIWLALFPGSMLGVEAASVFAIFTSQAWNMTFSFYRSLTSEPTELVEAAKNLHLSAWQRFWKLDVPNSMIPLLWNCMMSVGGGWFFLTASEMISVGNHTYALPGIGSFVEQAGSEGDMGKIGWAIAVMIAVVLLIDVCVWKPLTAWAEKFRITQSESETVKKSAVLTLIRHSHLNDVLFALIRPVGDVIAQTWHALKNAFSRTSGSRRPAVGVRTASTVDGEVRPAGRAVHGDGSDDANGAHDLEEGVDRRRKSRARRRMAGDIAFFGVLGIAFVWGVVQLLLSIGRTTGFSELWRAFGLGFITFARVAVLIVVCSLIWVPLGVIIGMNSKISSVVQPLVQVLASFPANFVFPFVLMWFAAWRVSLDFGSMLLMALGTQWYILFNVIAGASSIPDDLVEMTKSLHMSVWMRWKTLILPAVFGSWVTGGITAAGGAWNASIVSEIVRYNGKTLTAKGLGCYIAEATAKGESMKVLIGVVVMAVFVVALDRAVWQPLQRLADRRFVVA